MQKLLVILLFGSLIIHGLAAFSTADGDELSLDNEERYLIITTNELYTAVDSLKIWKEFLGYQVDVFTIEWIYANFQGGDNQEKIRKFIIDEYEAKHIHYVLLVGSRNVIPMRTCHPIPQEFEDTSIDTDYYYADLDGDWNTDNDAYFGEYDDDNMDFVPEVIVGRLPCDNFDTIKRSCDNIIKFESSGEEWKKNILLLGSIVYYQNLEAFNWTYERSDAATLMEKCRIDFFEPHGYSCLKMYEKEGIRPSIYDCELPLTRINALSEWTKGYGIVNMLGHSNERVVTRFIWNHDDGNNIPELVEGELSYVDLLRSSDGDELSLERPPIVFSDGCSQLHTSRNMGRSFIEDGAAVAFIGSTDLGLYNITRVWNDERDGGCFSIDYFFFKYFIQESHKCGDALYNSKIYFSNHFMFNEYNPDWIYRCYSSLYGFNLYGDPSMGLYPGKNDTNPPSVHIEKPQGGLYIFNKEIVPLPNNMTVILGDITLNIVVDDYETNIDHTEIWIDSTLKNHSKEKQFSWLWNEMAIGKHTITITSFDNAGNRTDKEFDVFIINI